MSNDDYAYTPDDRKRTIDDIRSHLGFKKPQVSQDVSVKNVGMVRVDKLDEADPHQQAKIFKQIQQNPPNPDFMKVQCFEGCDLDGNPKVFSRSIQLEDGSERWIEHDPFFEFSPYDGFKADIAAAPFHVIPRALDEKENVEAVDKLAHTPVKRKDKKDTMYLYILVFSVIGSITAGLYLLFGG